VKRNLHALLVGIDNYRPPLRPLEGCGNDIRLFQEYLKGRLDPDEFNLQERVLLDDEATYQTVIDVFRSHLGGAGENDIVVFYFSGHGSKEPCPEEFWHIEPDHKNETLVCYDSRPDGCDLADKELAKLIAEIAVNSPHIIIILDCCHSGSGTRDRGVALVRQAPEAERRRLLNEYIVRPDDFRTVPRIRTGFTGRGGWMTAARANHILLAACRDNQYAKEYMTAEGPHGAFSHFLLQSLQSSGGALSYGDLMKSVTALLCGNVTEQTPQLEVVDVREIDRIFLGGAITETRGHFTVSYDGSLEWIVDAGAVHGIPPTTAGPIRFALFPHGTSAEAMRRRSNSIGAADVIEVQPHLSRVRISGAGSGAAALFNASLISLPIAPTEIRLEGDREALRLVRDAIESSDFSGGPSLYIREATEDAKLRLSARNGLYVITHVAETKSLAAPLSGYTAANASLAVRRLDHIARWKAVNDLLNPGTGIPAASIGLRAFSGDEQILGSELRLEYKWKDGKWVPPRLDLCLSNRSGKRLYCALLSLSERFAIETGFFPAGGLWIEPGQEAWSEPMYGRIPDELWKLGINQARDFIKLLISTEEFDPRLLRQGRLDTPVLRQTLKIDSSGSALNCLMNRIITRELTADPGETLADWRASSILVTTVRPLEGERAS